MPVYLDRNPSCDELLNYASVLGADSAVEYPGYSANFIDIGIINNMPDAALQSTERQFVKLLCAAADHVNVRVRFYAIAEVPRSERARRCIKSFYSPVEELWDSRLDGLIVTGTEPQASNLKDEPYWSTFSRVLNWAEEHTLSTVWSCLAAHAAVLDLDGIGRQRLSDKRFGLYECERSSDHVLATGVSSRVVMPHSRWNDLREEDLVRCGYRILTRSDGAGVDAFVREGKSLFLFFQGHPEYEANTLLLEYRRDVGRYLRRERETFPGMPHGYFNADAAQVLTAIREQALRARREDLLADFPTGLLERTLGTPWRSAAVLLYTNWLDQLSAMNPDAENPAEFVQQTEGVLSRRLAAGAD